MIILKRLLLASSLLLLACSHVDQSDEVYKADASGAELAMQVCSACHGKSGESIAVQVPKLAGQHKEYIVIQLGQFKEHVRASNGGMTFMWSFSQLTNKQMQELGEYYSRQVPMKGEKNQSSLLVRGRLLYEKGNSDAGIPPCASCHGSLGLGKDEIPRLAGQHSAYLADQITLFKNSKNRPNAVAMMSLSHNLTEEDIKAVSIYLGSDQVGSSF